MREEMLKGLYDVYIEHSSDEVEEAFGEIRKYVSELTGREENVEEIGGLLAKFMHEVFMDSTNMILDFISGRGVI